MTRRDPRGNPVSTDSTAALEASEHGLWRMMSFYGTPLDDLDTAIAADPAWPLPRLMKAGFLLGLTEPSLAAEATLLLDGVSSTARGNEREQRHLAALRHLEAGDWSGAADAWGGILGDHPRDALALQWANLFDFHRGDARLLHDRVAAALPSWPEDDALHPYALALQAFGLEETGRYAEAEVAGRRALAGAARVPWAIHAVAHVMEMQGRHEEGARWMADWRRHWGAQPGDGSLGAGAEPNGFAGHLGWHEALFALEGLDVDTARRCFDDYLDASRIEITLQRVDAASLLWRLDLLGAGVGDRWRALLAGWPLDDASAGHSLFNDAHATLALIGAGETARARAWIARSLEGAAQRSGWNAELSREIGAPLLRGLLAFGEGRFGEATETIAPLRGRLSRIGGSHAQRDVVEQTLLAAAVRGGDRAAARALHEARTRAKPDTPLSEWWARSLR